MNPLTHPDSKWFVPIFSFLAIAAFHLAYLFPPLAFLMAVFAYALVRLTELLSPRGAFYCGLSIAVACYAPHLYFFWNIFHWVAGSLWIILAIWVAFFILAGWYVRRIPGIRLWAFLIALPILWTGLEYFRSELYYLKFAWLTPGLAFGKGLLVQSLGVYGTGFMTTAAGALAAILPPKKSLITGAILLALLALFTNIPADMPIYPNRNPIRVVLIQCEEPSLAMVRDALDTAISEHPDAALIIMSEYSLASPPTDALKNWCKSRGRTLIIGGMHFVDDTNTKYEDTAFVIDPTGSVVFTQGKSVPIQFFNDGLPAKEQHLWDSPWGKIGICICYDLSYTRVTDELIRQGAQLLIVPSMDAHHWGEYEHELHARIGPARAAEYGVPILRATSSGVSQIIRADGTTAASAAFSDQTAFISGELTIARKAHLPLDRYLAPICTVLTALIILCLLVSTLRRRLHKKASLAG